MVSAMIQMPKAAIPTEIKNDSALSICIPFQHLPPQASSRLRMKGGRMPHWRVLELQDSVSQFMVHGARDQPGERPRIVVEVDLPNILGEPHDAVLIFQRVNHRLGRAADIRQKGEPFRVVSFRFMFFGQVDDHDCTVHEGTLAGVNIRSALVQIVEARALHQICRSQDRWYG
jgi:hypothetical protein